jgi:Putative prokaryotic signal transducing protein
MRCDTSSVPDELAPVDVVATEAQAEALCALLRSAGIECMHRLTNTGAGAFDGSAPGGSREIVVRAEDVETAREVLRSS